MNVLFYTSRAHVHPKLIKSISIEFVYKTTKMSIKSDKNGHYLTSAVFDSHVSTLTIRITTPASIPITTMVIIISNRTYFPNDSVLRNCCFMMEIRLLSRVYEI